MNQTASEAILTTEGIPLKVSLQKSERKNKIRAFLLVAPLLVFILVTFLIPIADMLVRSIDDRHINTVFPKTFEVYKKWDRQDLPSEELYKTMFFEVKEGSGYSIGKATTRMNYAKSGWKSLLKKSKRKFKKIEEGPYKEQMIAFDKRWADIEYWKAIGVMVDATTAGYYLNAVEARKMPLLQSNAFSMLYGSIMIVSYVAISDISFGFSTSTSYVVSLLYLAIVASVLAFGAYLKLVANIGADKASYVNVFTPVVALLISTFFEDYQWSWTGLVGVVLIIVGNILVLFAKPLPGVKARLG